MKWYKSGKSVTCFGCGAWCTIFPSKNGSMSKKFQGLLTNPHHISNSFAVTPSGSSRSHKQESPADVYALHGSVYILQHLDMPHSHSLCGSVVTRVTELVRRLWIPDMFLQHTIEVARIKVARLLGFGVIYGGTHCGWDTPPVEVLDSATSTCPYQEKFQALELPAFGFICLFAIEDTCGPSTFQV